LHRLFAPEREPANVRFGSKVDILVLKYGVCFTPKSGVMPPMSAETATAPRIRQYEQVQRRAVLKPSVNFTRKRTVPQ
jgi:hypothetical protein